MVGHYFPVNKESIKEDFFVPFLEFFKVILNNNNEHMAIDVREIVNGHKAQIDRPLGYESIY